MANEVEEFSPLVQNCVFCGDSKWMPDLECVSEKGNIVYYWYVCLVCLARTPKATTRSGSIVMANMRRGIK